MSFLFQSCSHALIPYCGQNGANKILFGYFVTPEFPQVVPYVFMRSMSALTGALLVPCVYEVSHHGNHTAAELMSWHSNHTAVELTMSHHSNHTAVELTNCHSNHTAIEL